MQPAGELGWMDRPRLCTLPTTLSALSSCTMAKPFKWTYQGKALVT
jgi:hypothetical protein